MSALLSIAAVLIAAGIYLAIGAHYARSQSLRLFREARADYVERLGEGHPHLADRSARERTREKVARRVVTWPAAMIYDRVTPTAHAWLHHPLVDAQARADQYRKDADHWQGVARTGAIHTEREMARELARICAERAKEVQP